MDAPIHAPTHRAISGEEVWGLPEAGLFVVDVLSGFFAGGSAFAGANAGKSQAARQKAAQRTNFMEGAHFLKMSGSYW